MSRFQKLSHVLWHCTYHIIWTPKYRFRVLEDRIKDTLNNDIYVFAERLGCRIEELNIQIDHVHLLIKIPPKLLISKLMGILKGKTAMKIFYKFPHLKRKPYWGNHFWANGYCVDTVGVNEDMRIYEIINNIIFAIICYDSSTMQILELKKKFNRVALSFKLTTREKEVLLLYLDRLPRNEIAYSLKISKETVKMHLKNIYKKMGTNIYRKIIEKMSKFDE